MLASEVVAQSPANTTGERLPQVVYMLFPAYEDGTLQDALTAASVGCGGGSAGGAGTWVFTPRQVLVIWDQVAAAVEAMHSATPPMAHWDIKPHNVLLRARAGSAHVRRFAKHLSSDSENCGLWINRLAVGHTRRRVPSRRRLRLCLFYSW
jgi:serine/threonine protein kinase